jgi:hypothetical protein
VVAVARCEGREVLVRLNVNGADVDVDDHFAASPLLWVLRDVLGMRVMEMQPASVGCPSPGPSGSCEKEHL